MTIRTRDRGPASAWQPPGTAPPSRSSAARRRVTADPFRSVDQVLDALAALERSFSWEGDRRAVFATAYLEITRRLQEHLAAGCFHDRAWMAAYIVSFADKYRAALHAYETSNHRAVPRAWRLSFDTSRRGRGAVLLDLLFGINAHINHDLPLSLADVGIEPQRPLRHEDHVQVNETIAAVTGDIQRRIGGRYSAPLGALASALSGADHAAFNYLFRTAREHAWKMGARLADAPSDLHREAIRADIDAQSALFGQVMLQPGDAIERLFAPGPLFARWRAIRGSLGGVSLPLPGKK